jgi:hypothetical protein
MMRGNEVYGTPYIRLSLLKILRSFGMLMTMKIRTFCFFTATFEYGRTAAGEAAKVFIWNEGGG